MLVNILLLILGLVLLVKGADIFIDAGSNIAKIFKISEIILGLTFVSFGTSLPELLLSITGARTGNTEIVIGNIVGTSLFNICGILGGISIIHPIRFLRETVRKDMYMSFLTSTILLVILADTFLTDLTENVISRTDGLILLLFFVVFMYYTFYEFGEYQKEKGIKKEPKVRKKVIEINLKHLWTIVKNLGIAGISLGMVFVGSDLAVNNAVKIAEAVNLSQTFIAVTIIAIGTSLPEISTSIVAVKKGKTNIAVGNLIGSNMFNVLFILGVTSLIRPIPLVSTALWIDAIFFIFICIMLIIFTKSRHEITRKEGISLVSMYILYIIYVVIRK